MPMIHGETVKAVQQLLQDRGIEQRSGESWGDYISRGLGVSDAKTEAFLEALHSGCSIAESKRAAGIPDGNRAVRLARAVGTRVGRIRKYIAWSDRRSPARIGRNTTSGNGATEDQVNMTLQLPQRIDYRGTKAEDLAGTGAHDSQGG